jgi:glycine dehydrogenase (decarboxylating) alpha subunit (EC 1.4.4.2)
MDVANASMYDVGTATVEAAVMAVQNKKKSSNVVVSKGVHPETRLILHTYMKQNGIEVIEVDTVDGVTDMDKLAAAVGDETAGVIVQNPNFFGIFEDVEAAAEVAHGKKALLVDVVDPISLGIVKKTWRHRSRHSCRRCSMLW